MNKSFYFKVSKPKGLTLRETLNRCLILRVRENLEKGRDENSKMYGPIRGCSSAGRAPALQAGGHRFDPVHLHHAERQKGLDKNQTTIWAHSSAG